MSRSCDVDPVIRGGKRVQFLLRESVGLARSLKAKYLLKGHAGSEIPREESTALGDLNRMDLSVVQQDRTEC